MNCIAFLFMTALQAQVSTNLNNPLICRRIFHTTRKAYKKRDNNQAFMKWFTSSPFIYKRNQPLNVVDSPNKRIREKEVAICWVWKTNQHCTSKLFNILLTFLLNLSIYSVMLGFHARSLINCLRESCPVKSKKRFTLYICHILKYLLCDSLHISRD